MSKPNVHVCEGVNFVLLSEHEARTKSVIEERDRYLNLWFAKDKGRKACVEALERIVEKIGYKCEHGFRSECPNKDCLLTIAQSALALARKETQ